ncbi:MAG TPA: 23S rRNA (guanosine(2251)-2'-O)-methyltransferase RlmB, partial [Chloroflexota bacterium]|nr:23S rRNA (guanosine(2251)-2'-O)-methyltransferase RlmB [Chloroflexota bacterium]
RKPSETEKPGRFRKSSETEKPGRFRKSSETEKPGGFRKPSETEKPGGFRKPAGRDKAGGFRKPAERDKPGGFRKPAGSDGPGRFDRPGRPEKPRGGDRPFGLGRISIPPGLEAVSGKNAVREALRAGKRVRRLLIAQSAPKDAVVEEVRSLAADRGIKLEELPRPLMDELSPENQGVIALATPYEYEEWGELLAKLDHPALPPAVLLLDTVQDPQNLATLLRMSEAVGLDGVVLPKRRSVHVTPSVVRSSAGAVEHLPIIQVPNLPRAAEELKKAGLWVVGIDMDGDRFPWELDMRGPIALILGGEDHGIGQLLKEHCDFLVRLPMAGKVNSLNVATAGSVVLYEMVRQRTADPVALPGGAGFGPASSKPPA